MRNHFHGVCALVLGACVLLPFAACGSSTKNGPPNVGSGDQLLPPVTPGIFGTRRVDIVDIVRGEIPPPDTDADIEDSTPRPNGMMPPRVTSELRLEANRISHIDGLDIAAILRGDDPALTLTSYRNVVDAKGLTLDLGLRDDTNTTRRVQLTLTNTTPDLLVGVLRYEILTADSRIVAGGTYRLELERRPQGLSGE